MNIRKRFTALLLSVTLALTPCISNVAVYAAPEELTRGSVPLVNPKVIPKGTEISVSRDETSVTIKDKTDLVSGDTFIVYLGDLPLAFNALEVSEKDNVTTVAVEKADDSAYENMTSSGTMKIDETNSEFIMSDELIQLANELAAERKEKKQLETDQVIDQESEEETDQASEEMTDEAAQVGEMIPTFEYYDGELKITIANTVVTLSEMGLSHDLKADHASVAFEANWTIGLNGNFFEKEIPLGKMPIYGVGVVSLSLNLEGSVEVTGDIGGRLRIGLKTAYNDWGYIENEPIMDFSFGEGENGMSVNKELDLDVSLKVFAGFDVLVLRGGVFGELVGRTALQSQVTTFPGEDRETVYCDDVRFYMFLRYGFEADYLIPGSDPKTIATHDFSPISEGNPPIAEGWHFENGKLVDYCSVGMKLAELKRGNPYVDISGQYERETGILVTHVTLPYDLELEKLEIAEGGYLDTRDHDLTIEGDLVINGGTLVTGSGNVIVNGDFIVKNGKLDNWGTITVKGNTIFAEENADGDFTTADQITYGANWGTLVTEGTLLTFVSGEEAFMTHGTVQLENDWVSDSICVGANIQQNGQTVTVDGDLVQEQGEWHMQAGSLTVGKNYEIQGGKIYIEEGHLTTGEDFLIAKTVEEHESYDPSSGRLLMENADDLVSVYGDLVNYSYNWYKQEDGTIEIWGGLYDLNPTNYGGYTYESMNNNVVCFRSYMDEDTDEEVETEHIVHMETYGSGLANLKTDSKSCLVVDGYFNPKNLLSDIEMISDGAILTGGNLNGKTLDITGDVRFSMYSDEGIYNPGGATLDIAGGNLHVYGSLFVGEGKIKVNDGEIYITEDLVMAEEAEAEDADAEDAVEYLTYQRTGGQIRMTSEEDSLAIGGNLIFYNRNGDDPFQKGTILIAGDLLQLGYAENDRTASFHTSSGCSVRFVADLDPSTGKTQTGRHQVSFESAFSIFGSLEVEQGEILVADQHFCVENLMTDLIMESQGALINGLNQNGKTITIIGDVSFGDDVHNNEAWNLQGGKVEIQGDLNHRKRDIKIGTGQMHVTGDYICAEILEAEDGAISYGYIQDYGEMLRMSDGALLDVDGDFILYRNEYQKRLNNGTIKIGGDFYQLGEENCAIQCDWGQVTILDGDHPQKVVMEDRDSHFNILYLTQDRDQYSFQPSICWNELHENDDLGDLFKVQILQQPEDVSAGIKAKISFHVTAENAASYRWQYSKNGGAKWINCSASGYNTDTITVTVSTSNAANIYRCVVTGEDGSQEISDTAGVDLLPGVVITRNPQSNAVAMGEYAVFTVEADNAAGYQWQYSKDGSHWYRSGATGNQTDTLTVKGEQKSQGNRYRCVVTGIDGNTKKSLGCAMIVMTKAPQTCKAKAGETASFSLKAEGIETYQWQYSKDGGQTWYKSGASGAQTDTVTFTASKSNLSMIYRCKLTTPDAAYAFTKPVGFTD